MLSTIGVDSAEDLFKHLPDDTRLKRPLNIAPGKSEYEISEYFRARGAENGTNYVSFLGAVCTTITAP
jgi:glycine cleavage system pyridoxal-binding protein P